MPYKDKQKQREFQMRVIRSRRSEWFKSNGPCVDSEVQKVLKLTT